MAEIAEILEKIGLTKGESRVYLALLELGSSTTGHIVEKSRVSASKVYEILNRLAKKGIVSYIKKEKTRLYIAQDPKKLLDFLEEEEEKIKCNKKAIQEILPELMLKKGSGAPEPIAQVLEGKRGFMSAHDKLIDELGEGGKDYTMTTEALSLQFSDYFKDFNKRRMAKNISMWIIYPEKAWDLNKKGKAEERRKRTGYYPRICPEGFFIPTYIALIKDSCLLCMGTDKIISIIIRNKPMVDGFKKYFNYVWSISETPEGFPEYKGELF